MAWLPAMLQTFGLVTSHATEGSGVKQVFPFILLALLNCWVAVHFCVGIVLCGRAPSWNHDVLFVFSCWGTG